jgi:PilZ domain
MNGTTHPSSRKPNRRSAIRRPLRSDIHVECRKGSMGLGPNLTQSAVDLSQTGICLVLTAVLNRGDEAEVQITGAGRAAIRRTAEVAWSLPQEAGHYFVGLRFRPELSYAELQQVTRP